jgi:hypothetical protein
MTDRFPVDNQLDVMVRVAEAVEKSGHMNVAVFGEGANVPFAYTVGLGLADLPELAIYGLDSRLAGLLLNNAAEKLREGLLVVNQPVQGVASHPLMVVRMEDVSDLRIAHVCWEKEVEALQLVWPDAFGLYPWDAARLSGSVIQPVKGGLGCHRLTRCTPSACCARTSTPATARTTSTGSCAASAARTCRSTGGPTGR